MAPAPEVASRILTSCLLTIQGENKSSHLTLLGSSLHPLVPLRIASSAGATVNVPRGLSSEIILLKTILVKKLGGGGVHL